MILKPRVLVLHATGTNRDQDAALAFSLAGAETEIIPLNTLKQEKIQWSDFQILALPGGFSYADALGAGKLLALDLSTYFMDQVQAFVASGRPVIGICNGFQALVKSGILPGLAGTEPQATLTFNLQGRFECRWVNLRPVSQKCIWTSGSDELLYCPVAHGEGNFKPASQEVISALQQNDQVALIYSRLDGSPAGGVYPDNPNGSILDIAGICNPAGNVLGLMPHPENHIFPYQHPRRTRGENAGCGLPLFERGVQYAAQN